MFLTRTNENMLCVCENRKAQSARNIPIEFIRARSDSPAPDAIFALRAGSCAAEITRPPFLIEAPHPFSDDGGG